MPRTFLADSFDLGDPWHTPQCGTNGTYAGAPSEGQMCCVDKQAPLGPLCKGDHRGEWALNDTRDWCVLKFCFALPVFKHAQVSVLGNKNLNAQ